MAGIDITSVNRQAKDISQEIYAAKLQRDEMQAKSVNKDEMSGLQNATIEKLSDRSNKYGILRYGSYLVYFCFGC